MAHPRKLLRAAVVAQLIAANTAAGTRVHKDRVDPLKKGSLPAISVFVLSEQVAPESATARPRELTRDNKVEIVGWVSGGDEGIVADAMDDIAEQIEAAIDASPYIGGNASDSILESTEMEIREGASSDPLIGIIALTYSVTLRTSPAPPALDDDFLGADVTTQVADSIEDDTVPAEDTFNVRETPP